MTRGVADTAQLAETGVEVSHRHYERVVHGFFGTLVDPENEQARDAVAAAADDLRAGFAG